MPSKSAIDKILSDAAPEATKTKAKAEAKAVVSKSNQELAKAQKLVQKNAKELKEQDQVTLSMAPMYRPYFGDVMTVSLNGLSIYFPLDGRGYKIPKAYAQIIQERRRRVDEHIMRTQRLANVTQNFERSAGELELIPR